MFKLSNLSGLQIYQLLRFGGFTLVAVCFAQLHIPQTLIGQFETFILLSGMVSFFWVSGIINAMLSAYPLKEAHDKPVFLFNTFLLLTILSPFAAAALFVFAKNILTFLSKDGGSDVLVYSIIYLIISCPSFLAEYILFLNNRNRDLIAYGAITALLTIMAAVGPVMGSGNIIYSLYAMIAMAILRWIYTLLLLQAYGKFKVNSSFITELLKLSAPIILSIFVAGSAEYIDGIIVKSKFDNMFFAIYRYGAKELPVLLVVANTFSVAMIPALASNLSKGLAELKAKTTQLMHIFFPLTIVLGICSPYIYKYVLSSSFIYSSIIFNIYLLLIISRVLFPQTILTGMRQTKWLVISSMLEIIINVSLSLYLAGTMGLAGIAVGTFVAYLFDKLFLMGAAYFLYGVKPVQYVNIGVYFVYVVLTLVAAGTGCYLAGTI